MFDFFYPGQSAHLVSVWNGLDAVAQVPYPLMGLLAKPFGLSNYLAPVLGVLAAIGLYLLVSRVVRHATVGEDMSKDAVFAGRLAGGVATLVFVLSSALISSATHVEPALFGVVATLLAALALAYALSVRSWVAYLLVSVAGMIWGFFGDECPLATICAPLATFVILGVFRARTRLALAFAAVALFGFGFALGFLVYAAIFSNGFVEVLVMAKRGLLAQISFAHGGGARAVFAVLPFLVAMAALPVAFGEGARLKRVTLAHVALLPLVYFGLFSDFPATSVASAAFVAAVTGEVIAYFVVTARVDFRNRASVGLRFRNVRFVSRYLAAALLAVCGLLAIVRALANVDTSYSFADRFAGRVLDSLGSRTWLVTDGRLDDHLKILAARRGLDVVFVNASRDLDPDAQKSLAVDVKRRLGEKSPSLLMALDLGILPFLEDWVKTDPSTTNAVAVMGAPDILSACGLQPVPEVFVFGADPGAAADWSVWPELAKLLPAPEGWGSVNLPRETDLRRRMQLDLRRHLGLVANNRGVWLEDHGDRDGAFRMYTLVLDEIDSDNVSALFNALAMAEAGYQPAVQRELLLKKKMKAIVADEARRYRLWALANYYGSIRNIAALVSRGYAWARSGRPGAALDQIRRAIDLVPTDQRWNLMNMMAALLADADQREQSRRVYEFRLTEKQDDHAALIGLVRLELLAGNEEQAKAYLARAVAAGGDDPRVQVELSILEMMKGNLVRAKEILKAVTTTDAGNIQAWSMLAAVTMQLSDAAKDPTARAALDRELEEKILPTMEAKTRGADSYYVHSARAFLALRKGEAGHRAAREALKAAVEAHPDSPVARELLIGMDIALNDAASAEADARRTLRKDRNSPMANYVMGSLALGKNDLVVAEAYLKRAVSVKKPNALALNDYAETLRLMGHLKEAEPYARRVVKDFPGLYAGWDTLACIILETNGDAAEALADATKAVELATKDGRVHDVGLLLTLARAQALQGDRRFFSMTMRKIEGRANELNDRQKKIYEALKAK